MADAGEVLVLGECLEGQLTPITGEIIAAGRQLADDLGIAVACGLIGDEPDGAARTAVTLGADRAYVVD
ncbi:MAG: electron transfer flavoprotein subunit alpha, partial [Candidatus Tectomicrobia bacterium]|nr:electron transfer flavoprotein subunit alpha [Candidatus Tectomicrobia bacterium]